MLLKKKSSFKMTDKVSLTLNAGFDCLMSM